MSRKKRTLWYHGRSFLIPVLGLGLAVCGRDTSRQAETAVDTTGVVPPAAETPAPGTGTVPPGGMATALSVPEITSILSTSDSAEIMPSRLALEKAQNAAVKAYAQRMINDHGMLEDSLRAMMSRQNITPAPSQLTHQLHNWTESTVQRLRGLSGAEFDQAYMQAMVQSHQEALNMIDNQILPATQDQQLRMALTQQVRPLISSHLTEAQQIQQTLGTPTQTTGGR